MLRGKRKLLGRAGLPGTDRVISPASSLATGPKQRCNLCNQPVLRSPTRAGHVSWETPQGHATCIPPVLAGLCLPHPGPSSLESVSGGQHCFYELSISVHLLPLFRQARARKLSHQGGLSPRTLTTVLPWEYAVLFPEIHRPRTQ